MTALLNLLFPSLCCHCNERKETTALLCLNCSEEIDLSTEEPLLSPSQLNGLSYALSLEGPSTTLRYLFQKKQHLYLAKPLVHLLYLKMDALQWPAFDLMLPLPKGPFHRLLHGFDPDALLAKTLAKLIGSSTSLKPPLFQQKVLIISSTLDLEKINNYALMLSSYLPSSIHSISLWSKPFEKTGNFK